MIDTTERPATAVPLAWSVSRPILRVVPDLPDHRGRHYVWHDDLNVLAISPELYEALRFVDGVVSGRTLLARRRRGLPRGYRPTVNDLGLLHPGCRPARTRRTPARGDQP